MGTLLEQPSDCLAEWVIATDGHAARRLPLLEMARRIISGVIEAEPQARRVLAIRLERWRYQHLDLRRGEANCMDLRLAEVLDLATNRLLGLAERPPRWTREAISHTGIDWPELHEALAALDARMPLDQVTAKAAALTAAHFSIGGRRRMFLYAPLYLSSHCVNYCVYCGFRFPNAIPRRHLSIEEAVHQAEILGQRGIRHILLVAGDYPRLTNVGYLSQVVRRLADCGFSTAVEIAPQGTLAYAELAAAGACGVTLYQETYNEQLYAIYHPRGTKCSYDWRLEGLERAAEGGMQRLGFGILLGLADPREDLAAMMRHARYVARRFPHCTIAFSLPRIYEAPAGFQPPFAISDELFVRLYCALRIAFPKAELVLSTREPAELRNRLARICITQLSAGSSTVPGGYENGEAAASGVVGPAAAAGFASTCGGWEQRGGQFPVCDNRSPAEVAAWLTDNGFQPVWTPGAGSPTAVVPTNPQ